jgi:hypothetical protein
MVIGDRQTRGLPHFSPLKKVLQQLGSAMVRRLSGTEVADAVSGFRAFTRETALKLTILSFYSYTIESVLQARTKGITIANVPVRANPPTRRSRLMKSIRSYIARSTATMIRIFTMYHPLRVFLQSGILLTAAGCGLGLRFLYYFVTEGGQGKIQSLILASMLVLTGVMAMAAGVLADLIQFNRRLTEDVLERVRRLEGEVRRHEP